MNEMRPLYRAEEFQFETTLGKGSFGTVNKVLHKQSGNIYAMKVVEKKLLVEKQLEDQFKREVVTQLKANHTNVVRMMYYFEDRDTVSCLLEYADQGQLFAYLKKQPGGLPEPRAASFFRDTARGVQYLHSLCVIHRDIKPENILLFTEALTCKIADLGWCVELTQDRPERLTFCGTMDYLPPEMLYDEPHDFSLDMWALGILLFEMLVARPPFVGSSPKQIAEQICNGDLQIPSGSMSEGPAEIIRGVLVRDRSHRWPIEKVLSHPWMISLGGSIRSIEMDVTVPARPPAPERRLDDTADSVALEVTRAACWEAGTEQVRKQSPSRHASSALASEAPEINTQNLATVNADLLSRIREQMDDMNKSFQAKVAAQQDRQKDKIIDRAYQRLDTSSAATCQEEQPLRVSPQASQAVTWCEDKVAIGGNMPESSKARDIHPSSRFEGSQQDRPRDGTTNVPAKWPNALDKSDASVHVSDSSDEEGYQGNQSDTVWSLRRRRNREMPQECEGSVKMSSSAEPLTDSQFLTNVDDRNVGLEEFDRDLLADIQKPSMSPITTACAAARGSEKAQLHREKTRQTGEQLHLSRDDKVDEQCNVSIDYEQTEDSTLWSSSSLIVDAGASVWTTLFTGLVALGAVSEAAIGAVSDADRKNATDQQLPVVAESHKIGRRCWGPA